MGKTESQVNFSLNDASDFRTAWLTCGRQTRMAIERLTPASGRAAPPPSMNVSTPPQRARVAIEQICEKSDLLKGNRPLSPLIPGAHCS
jgi:hypothetical protein